jgi:acyl transferase domain-containing protein/NAD(P)-dependent dehydrogenase (short-subunit alcohol dehydrogenase family)
VRTAPIAILGSACRLPDAETTEELWRLFSTGASAIREIPGDRLDQRRYYDPRKGQLGKTYSKLGGCLKALGASSGDDSFDLCHRMFSDVAKEALLETPYNERLEGRRVGVYVGHSGGTPRGGELVVATLAGQVSRLLLELPEVQALAPAEHQLLVQELSERIREQRPTRDAQGGPYDDAYWIAGLLARELQLDGPQVVVDAACASSLMAFVLAAQALSRGEIDLAIVGGASFQKTESLQLFSHAQSCSATGSRPFDQDADGLISSEGLVAMVCKRADRALSDGDPIQAVVRGIGISTDGRGRSLWAPQAAGQVAALQRCYQEIAPHTVSYLEAHATSTQLGDATELEALATFFGPRSDQDKLLLGSAKSNLGHTLETAGLTSLLKVVLSLRHGELPPTVHLRHPNEAVRWPDLPLELVLQARPWPAPADGLPRRAGVSAFGVGGLNVHLLVEQASALPVDAVPNAEQRPVAVIGRGLIAAGVTSVDDFAQALESHADRRGDPPAGRWPDDQDVVAELQGRPWTTTTRRGGYVRDFHFDAVKHKIPPNMVSRANPLQLWLLEATGQAVAECGQTLDRERTAVVVGASFSSDFGHQLQLGYRHPEIREHLQTVLRQRQAATEPLLDRFDQVFFQTYPAILDESGGFTSSSLASRLSKAHNWQGGAFALEAGAVSSAAAIKAGCDLLQAGDVTTVVVAVAQGCMDLVHFEKLARLGRLEIELPGEAVAVVILKDLEQAQKDGHIIHGVIRESGVGGKPPVFAEKADEIDAAPSHLAKALREPYGQVAAAPGISEQFGETCASSGMLSLLRATLHPPGHLVAILHQSETGQVGHLLVEGGRQLMEPPSPLTAHLSGSSLPELAGRCRTGPRIWLAGDRARLAVVASDPERLQQKLSMTANALEGPAPRRFLEDQGVFHYVDTGTRPRVAFVFSGQGSQYRGMLKQACEFSPAARQVVERADRCLSQAGLPSFSGLRQLAPELLHGDPVVTQLGLLIADLMLAAMLDEAGFRPDCVCGHSFGEIPALVSAKVLSLEDAFGLTRVRATALLEASPDGGLLSVRARAKDIEELVGRLGLFFTHFNADEQTVVGGRTAALEDLARTLGERGIACARLRVPGALHTPLVASAQPKLERYLAGLKLRPPTCLTYSNVSNRPATEPEEIRRNLVRQLTEPVRYHELLQRLYADDVRLFIEVGPGQVLTRLGRQNLSESDAIFVAADHPKGHLAESLASVSAACACLGRETVAKAERSGGRGRLDAFDATQSRREKLKARAQTAVVTAPLSGSVQSVKNSQSRVESFLLDHVANLTGYPRQALSLDWEVEADLGIDSIKRVQLLGELRDVFGLNVSDRELQGARTLREIAAFVGAPSRSAAPPPSDEASSSALFLEGLRYGGQRAQEIREELRFAARQGRWTARSPEEVQRGLSPAELEHLRGVAEGAGVHLGGLLAFQTAHGRLPGTSRPLTSRYTLALEVTPLPVGLPAFEPEGTCLILGDNPASAALVRRLGSAAYVFDTAQPLDHLLEQFDALPSPVPHLFLTTAWEAESNSSWSERRVRGVTTPFWLCRRWLEAAKRDQLMNQATVAALTRMGGGFGIGTPVVSAEGGFLSGLLKSLRIESWVAGFRDLRVRVVDCPEEDAPADSARLLLQELAHGFYDLEIGSVGGERVVVRPKPRPLVNDISNGSAHSQSKPVRGIWVCTGGARGITAHVACELARHFNLTLHLLGRAPTPDHPPEWRDLWLSDRPALKIRVLEAARRDQHPNPVLAWESVEKGLEVEATLRKLAELGVEASYHSCELADPSALARTLETIRKDGPIRGVLHGAGATRDAKFEDKDPVKVKECFRAKLDGTRHLMELTDQDPLDVFVTFGSISGRFGANGHADYSAANDMLAKMVSQYRQRRPEVGAVNFHWHAWGDVGMAVKGESQLGLELVDMKFMPAAEGIEHFLTELHAGVPEAEVVITEESYFRRFSYGDLTPEEHLTTPLLGSGRFVLDPRVDPFLRDHRLDGVAVLPLAVALEAICESVREQPSQPLLLSDVRPRRFLKFHGDRPLALRVLTERSRARLVCDHHARDGTLLESDRPVLEASVRPGEAARPTDEWEAPDGAWQPVEYHVPEGGLALGPSLRCLRRYLRDRNTLWGQLVAPSLVELAGSQRSVRGWRLPSALLDGCFYAAGVLAWQVDRQAQTVPLSIGELWVGALPTPGELCLVKVSWLGQERFCFDLHTASGELVLKARDYRIAWLESPLVTPA